MSRSENGGLRGRLLGRVALTLHARGEALVESGLLLCGGCLRLLRGVGLSLLVLLCRLRLRIALTSPTRDNSGRRADSGAFSGITRDGADSGSRSRAAHRPPRPRALTASATALIP